MKQLFLLLLFFVVSKDVSAQCDDLSRNDAILFLTNNNNSALQFIFKGQPQFAFWDNNYLGYKYPISIRTNVIEKDITFNTSSFIKIISFNTQELNGKCLKILTLERDFGLDINANISYSFYVDDAKITSPNTIIVSPNDKKMVSTQLEGYNYKFPLSISALINKTDHKIEQSETDIKDVILQSDTYSWAERLLISHKTFEVNHISYTLSQ
jgi:hypothetical protein